MTKSNFGTKGQSNTGSDEEPRVADTDLGQAAETGGDLATQWNGKEMAESTSSSGSPVQNRSEAVSNPVAPTLDPVCGMSVDERSALHVVRDGKRFYFCSDQCRQKFLATLAGVKSDSKAASCCG